jgi:hypothetical protein
MTSGVQTLDREGGPCWRICYRSFPVLMLWELFLEPLFALEPQKTTHGLVAINI